MHNLTVSVCKWLQIGQILLLPTNRKLHNVFPLAYLYLTLTHSKGQGHTHFNYEFLANDDR